ncbi:hypothetical protein GA0115240_156429 [Streptomyces sp. DvalAA-14]|nr:hypothetical protein GA0115240_156429 [Streptomyces sp. DvalAA-14]
MPLYARLPRRGPRRARPAPPATRSAFAAARTQQENM